MCVCIRACMRACMHLCICSVEEKKEEEEDEILSILHAIGSLCNGSYCGARKKLFHLF
jgi:hypothetical protein